MIVTWTPYSIPFHEEFTRITSLLTRKISRFMGFSICGISSTDSSTNYYHMHTLI
ncbi:MAG TPA: hypothetical protein VD699_05700 [Nitrosopumilaceae archaeon]|nr:hypothetical protein [Nitrosopumilaceae archaeon]HXV39044.1 hypothetical protein [Nitrosopumilaceae archaeon]